MIAYVRVYTFAHYFRLCMTVDAVSQTEMAKRLDVSTPAVNYWAHGSRRPDTERLIAICQALPCMDLDSALTLLSRPNLEIVALTPGVVK